MFDQVLVKNGNTLLTEPLVEFDQRGGIGNRVHERKSAEVTPGESFLILRFRFLSSSVPQRNFRTIKRRYTSATAPGRPMDGSNTFSRGLSKWGLERPIDFFQFFAESVKRKIDNHRRN